MLKFSRQAWAWASYDWANSAFYTTVVAGFFPIFFKLYWSEGVDVSITTSRLGLGISLTSLTLALISPLFGAYTDERSKKKSAIFFLVLLGSLSLLGLSFVEKGLWSWALIFYLLTMFMCTLSCIAYDSLLPAVARGIDLDRTSALGYSLGYLGGGLLFALNVWMFLDPTFFGLKDGVQAVLVSFISVAIWWFVFTLPLMWGVQEKAPAVRRQFSVSQLFQQNLQSFKEIWRQENLRYQVLSSWILLDGVNTIIAMAVDYGVSLHLESKHLITALLITQFVGFPCAYIFGYWGARYGCKRMILIAAAVYFIAIGFATQISEASHFYILAALIGSVQGGVQALSRSLFAKLIPEEKSGEYFAVYNLIGKYASIMGPFLISLLALLIRQPRYSILAVGLLFVVGSFLLLKVQEPKDSPSTEKN